MKYVVVAVLAAFLCFSTALASPEVGKTAWGGDFWFGYQMDRVDESTQQSAFGVHRGYIGLSYGWSPEVSGQMTINVFSSPRTLGWTFELVDAYVDWMRFVPNGKMRIGLQKNYFASVYDWKDLTVRPSFAEAVGIVEERDYGIAFLGWIPNEMGEWGICLMNGEGYSSGFNPPYADKQPGVMLNVRLSPARQTTVGFSLLRDRRYVYPWPTQADGVYESSIGYEPVTAFSFLAGYGSGPFTVSGEYLYYDYYISDRDNPDEPLNVKGAGFTIFPRVRVSEKLEVVGRYDSWDPDKDCSDPIWDDPTWGTADYENPHAPGMWWLPRRYAPEYYYVKHDVYVVGFNYNITERKEGKEGVILQFNWQRLDPKEQYANVTLDPVDSFVFQVKWGWGDLDL